MILRYIFLMRMHHWVKNLFVLVPAFFSGDLFLFPKLRLLMQGFFCFCLLSSAVYIFNDLMDIESDRKHPTKSNRPIPSGKVPFSTAIILMVVLAADGLVWSYWLNDQFFLLMCAYAVINIGYSVGLKNITLIDVFLVSSGFLIRTLAGGVIVHIPVSQWLIVMVFLLALLLTFSKRRDNLIQAKSKRALIRRSCREYNLEFINIVLAVLAGVIMVSYLMYTFSDNVRERIGENYLYVTSLFVIGGILRYLQITLVKKASGSPTRVFLTDKIIQFTIIAWTLTFFITIYVI